MSIGESGFPTPSIANLGAETAPPTPPTELEVLSIGLQDTGSPDELAKLIFKFKRPTTSDLTITDAKTDDVYNSGVSVGTVDGNFNTGIKIIDTTTDLTGLLSADDRIFLGTQTTRYIVDNVTSAHVEIKYGLLAPVTSSDDIKLLTKTDESPTDSRQLRINSVVGDVASIYYEDGDQLTKWDNTATLGQWEDLNKILVLINESVRQWTIEKITSGATPVYVTVDGNIAAGAVTVPISADISSEYSPGESVSFDSGVTFYILSEVNPTNLVITTGLSVALLDDSQVWLLKEYTDDATPVPFVFEDYDQCVLAYFSGTTVLDDLGGYNLYYKETLATQSVKGVLASDIAFDDSNLVNNSDGTSQYTYNAPTTYFDGRLLYWSLSAYDQRIPTPNESEADLNAYAVSFPGQAHITEFTEDLVNLTMDLTYERITSAGANPHLDDVMNGSTAQYSQRGGYDIFSKELIDLETANGFYEGIDEDNGKYVNTGIILGNIVRVVDVSTRNVWITTSTIAGEVSLNDTVLTFGTTGINYVTGHSSVNIVAQGATIDRDTDSVLPLDDATPATPVKQYLTDFTNVYTIEYDSPATYGTVIESVDTEIEKGKL